MRVLIEAWCALCLTVASGECLRTLQATGYRPQRGYVRLLVTPYYALLVAVQCVTVACALLFEWGIYANAALLTLLAAVCVAMSVRRKCPLKLTKRIWRQLAVQCAVLEALALLPASYLWVWLLPLVTLLTWAICLPVETAINGHYLRAARRKLAESGVVLVAVTGSYGKTSVKDMLAVVLDGALAPKGSCNTPLGIAAYINRTDLTAARYLVLEFGARRRGDIAELCRLFPPCVGVVTGVCAQHLATFKSLDNVLAAKRELVEQLPREGFCVLNARDERLRAYADSGVCAKYFSDDNLRVSCTSVDFDGSRIEVEQDGMAHSVTLPQIADYVADTFAICLQVATRLGQSMDRSLANAHNISPTPHRLELRRAQGFCILDDSYNGSMAGVESCCRTLAKFPCVKVVITQGLTECGKARRQMNEECGRLLGGCCDLAIVMGRNGRYLAEGLYNTPCRVLFARDLDSAVKAALPLVQGGILLFQNDLPDDATAL